MYLRYNPAERISLFSWFAVMSQRIEIFWLRATWWDHEALDDKFRLGNYYQDMVQKVSKAECKDPQLGKKINEIYLALQEMDLKSYQRNASLLNNSAYDFNLQIKEWCK